MREDLNLSKCQIWLKVKKEIDGSQTYFHLAALHQEAS